MVKNYDAFLVRCFIKEEKLPTIFNPPINIIENNKKAGNGWKIKERQQVMDNKVKKTPTS